MVPQFKRLAAAIFGETEEKMQKLIPELREAVEEEGLVLPGWNYQFGEVMFPKGEALTSQTREK